MIRNRYARLLPRCLLLVLLAAGWCGRASADAPPSAPPAAASLGGGGIPQASYGIHGSLDGGYIAYFGPYYEQPNALLSLQINYTPASAPVQLGICTGATQGSCFSWQPIANGSGSAGWQVTQAGYFYLAIWNQSAGGIDYNGVLQA